MALVVAAAVLPVGRTVTLHALGGFKKGGVTVGSDGVAARVVAGWSHRAAGGRSCRIVVWLVRPVGVRLD